MTTIAFDGRYIAVDSQITHGDTKLATRKLFDLRTPEGLRMVVFGCGDWGSIQLAAQCLQDGQKLPKGDYNLLAWSEGGDVAELSGGVWASALGYDHLALGSGAFAALGAMKMGASAGTAVQIAAEIDVSTGLPVLVLDTRTGKIRKAATRRKTTPEWGS